MPRSLPPEQQQEFDHLISLTMALAEAEDSLDTSSFSAIMHMNRVDYYKGVLSSYRPIRSHISGLREGLNDTLEDAGDWRREKFLFVDSVLRQRCGVTLDSLLTRRLARISLICKRGRINTDEQFRLIYSRVDQISGNIHHSEEFVTLTALMSDYERHKARK